MSRRGTRFLALDFRNRDTRVARRTARISELPLREAIR